MYKVLIVDDEKIVRVGLQAIVKWEEEGFQIIGMAQDGKQALQQVEKYEPDIIITDFKMPHMDGLTLTKTLREEGFGGEIIILTNYGEFELAREALRYEVNDYLLKATLRPEELTNTLRKLKHKLDKKWKEEENSIINLKNGEVVEEDKEVIATILSIWEESKPVQVEERKFASMYQFIVISKLSSKLESQNTENHQLRFYQQSIENIIKEITDLDSSVQFICGKNIGVCLIAKDQLKSLEDMEKLSLQIQSHLYLYTNIRVAVVIGEDIRDSLTFYENFRQCMESTVLIFYKGYKVPIAQKESQKIDAYMKIIEGDFLVEFKTLMDKGDSNGSIKSFYQFVDAFYPENIPVGEAKTFLDKFVKNIILDYGFYFEKYKDTLKEISTKYRNTIILQEVKEITSELIYTICNYIGQVKDIHYRKEVQQIIHYIHQNIDKKITLASIAEEINMNESYISRLFKNETGNNLVNYINLVKMEKAKELLKNPDHMVKDVANALGFEEQSYFNKMFKKYFGMNPNDYKKME